MYTVYGSVQIYIIVLVQYTQVLDLRSDTNITYYMTLRYWHWQFEHKIYWPAQELNPAPPIDCSGAVLTVTQSPETRKPFINAL